MEALGGAASVIGVTSLAIQVCEELRKVHDFWQSVKEAPEDIVRITTEVKLFMTWLAVIANNYQRHGFDDGNPNHVAATDTLQLCLETARDMNAGVRDLENRLSAGLLFRKWASVKFVFRKDKREKAVQQMERMKTLLLIVQTCHIGEIQEAGFRSLSMTLRSSTSQATSQVQCLDVTPTATTKGGSVIENQQLQTLSHSLGEKTALDPRTSSQICHRPKYGKRQQKKRIYNLGFGMIQFDSTKQDSILTDESGDERRIPTRRNRYDFRTAQWLLSSGFSWYSISTYSNWQYSFRTFRYIPWDSLIVKFCSRGDVANVQKMFDQRLASPFDRVRYKYEYGSEEDWSLLHFAAYSAQAQMCRFLIGCGLGHGSASGMSICPILFLAAYNCFNDHSMAELNTVRVMINEGQYDPMEESVGDTMMHRFNGPPMIFRWILDQEDFFIDFEQGARGRTIAFALMCSKNSPTSEYLKVLFTHEMIMKDPSKSSLRFGFWHLIRDATYNLKLMADNSDLPKRIKVLWDAGVDLHAPEIDENAITPLEALLDGAPVDDLLSERRDHRRRGLEHDSTPVPLPGNLIEYDRLEVRSAVKYRPRTSRSLWRTWYPGNDLSIMEVLQRYLDAWMEVLLEAGLDLAEYGQREEGSYPEGLLEHSWGYVRIEFEYGEHVDGCRIHVTEVWIFDLSNDNHPNNEEKAISFGKSAMPGGWSSDEDVESGGEDICVDESTMSDRWYTDEDGENEEEATPAKNPNDA